MRSSCTFIVDADRFAPLAMAALTWPLEAEKLTSLHQGSYDDDS
jgi:hypothetical protein